ncbi:S-adenosyl-L-methionine-dependent methyltransferase [Trichocladium antarcticum]|uniref:S-adenosyl-L-methionine-dependent methyltransferase n=1 Tax=Trichocladium antarcticum TaxID=1450529 RepID=A0AAN6UJ37_9PEZI|nr:S-adenosyl-L-methionine-dependent methyltransferase [Trichocladium antarcticum]
MSTLPGDKPREDASDWSPDQYLLFRTARDRAIHDLIAFLGPDYAPQTIVDLGCGPGNSTALLTARFPTATITGVDSSPAMLTAARTTLPNTTFTQANLLTYSPPPGTDLLFSNAVFHWLRRADRLPTITRLLQTQARPGAVLALQMPDNHAEPSHAAMRATAAAAPRPWTPYFQQHLAAAQHRPDLDPLEPSLAYYDALRPHCRGAVEIWTTRYEHLLEGVGGIVEWVRATGLMPFLNVLPAGGGVREGFLDEYRQRLEQLYPRAVDGRVMLGYPRRFVVAFR